MRLIQRIPDHNILNIVENDKNLTSPQMDRLKVMNDFKYDMLMRCDALEIESELSNIDELLSYIELK